MAVTAEQLNIILSARDKEFTKAMDRAQRRVESFAKKSQKELKGTSKSFNLLSTAALKMGAALSSGAIVAGFAKSIDDATRLAKEINNLADISGSSVERFQELAFAAKTVGIEQDKLADILKDVNDKFGDYIATGAGPLVDFFDNIAPKIGLTKDAFIGLSSEQALGLYIKSLQQANVNQQELTFYLEALASDATALSPLFYNNAEALDALAGSAQDLGVILDEDLIQRSVQLRNRWDQVLSAMQSKFNSFALTVLKGFDAIFNISETEQMRELEEEITKIEKERARLSDLMQKASELPESQLKTKTMSGITADLNKQSEKLNATLELHKAIVDNLEKRINLENELSGSGSGTTTDTSNATSTTDALTNSTAALTAEVTKLETVMSTVESSMEQAFMSMVDGTMTAKDAFKAMASDIIRELYRIFLVKQATKFITSSIESALGVPTSAPTAGAASGRAVQSGTPYMTGESGRELFVPSQNGRILSPAQSRGALSGGGNGVTVVQNINVTTGVQQTVRTEIKQLMPQIADSAKAAVVDAKRRGGSYGRAFA